QRNRRSLLGLIAGVALQRDAVQIKDLFHKSGTVHSFRGIRAPEVWPAKQRARGALDVFRGWQTRLFPGREILGGALRQEARSMIGQFDFDPFAFVSGSLDQIAENDVRDWLRVCVGA